jgi:Derlin-2/3
MAQAGAQDLFAWYNEIPIVSRVYLTAAIGLSTACFMDFISPLTLYFNYDLIVHKQQIWRIVSSFLFFGSFSLDFLFHLYFVSRYCRLLEEGPFRARTAEFILFLIVGGILTILFAMSFDIFSRIKFLGHPLAFTMVYVWARWPENMHVRMSLFGIFPFNAPYLPWILLLFSLFIGNPIETDLLGIVVGHIYYYLDFVYPQVAALRGWPLRKILVAPAILHYICGDYGNNGFMVR